jgi:hypothetical protein
MIRPMARTPILILVFLFFVLQGCSGLRGTRAGYDFSQFQDQKMSEELATWLEGGEQSATTDRIAAEAKSISGANRRERVFGAMVHIWRTFSYDPWLNAEAFRRTAEELFTSRALGGCSDFALVEITLFRALGIPSRMVITANMDWIYSYGEDRLAMSEGHSFIEVFLEDKWYLVDTTYRYLFSCYDPESPSYPHGEYFCRRGKDFWDMGIRNLQDAEETLRHTAANYKEDFQEPRYPKHPL